MIVEGMDGYNAALTGDKSSTLGVNCGMSTGRNGVLSATCRNSAENEKSTGTYQKVTDSLMDNTHPGSYSGQDAYQDMFPCNGLTVRRLTPLECERLQGFPDGWTDIGAWVDENGKIHAESTDSARYKALGNSIALPPWAYVLTRLSLCVGCGHPTMASLFDGIGGFPLIWEWLNGKGSCLWASEIEDFPIAVTKYHFPEEE